MIISWIKKIFYKESNPEIEILFKALKRMGYNVGSFKSVFHLGTCLNNESNYQFISNSNLPTIIDFLKKSEIDVNEDLLQTYIIKCDQLKLVILNDPFEVFEPESILKIESINEEIDLEQLNEIYISN